MTILLSEEDMIKYPGTVSIAISYPAEQGKTRLPGRVYLHKQHMTNIGYAPSLQGTAV
jgi:hypothetical protein